MHEVFRTLPDSATRPRRFVAEQGNAGALRLLAQSKSEKKENGKEKEYTRREYSYNSFTRSFRLPDDVKDDSIAASYQDGVLNLELPKSKVQTRATKEIAIN